MSSPKLIPNLILFVICVLGFGICRVKAVYNPVSVPNNRIGVHILDPGEIFDAAKLVNSSGGTWGYVTVPIRSDDRNRYKWQQFFRKCTELKLIPILRLTTYFTGTDWTAPEPEDLVDFANFLNDMPWPVKNRYIIVFNEPNHANEWGGRVSPPDYLTILLVARDIFKSRSADFFLLSAGMDMSAPTNSTSLDALDFYRRMFLSDANWPAAIDGYSFHAYPNPGFSAPVTSAGRYNISSYQSELRLINKFYSVPKPYIISETGSVIQEKFYPPAMSYFLADPRIFAVTPFLLFAGEGSFYRFSLLDRSNQPNPGYRYLSSLTKINGSPLLSETAIFPETIYIYPDLVPQINPPPKNSLDRLYWWLYEMVSGSGH